MDKAGALQGLSALGQETRLDAFRLLVQAGRDGLAAGDISARLAVPQNTMSSHLSVLRAAGLVTSQRQQRSVRYFADMGGMRVLLGFLMQDCCGGQTAQCQPVLDQICCDGVCIRA